MRKISRLIFCQFFRGNLSSDIHEIENLVFQFIPSIFLPFILYIFLFFFFFFASVDHFSFGEFLLLCIHYRQRVAFNSINKHCTRFETTINDAPRGFAVHDRHHYQLLSDSPIIGNNNSFWRLVQRLYRPHTLQSNLLQ